jgi:antitoxin VapB
MALMIKSNEAGKLARDLAKATGESIATAVTVAIAERLARVTRRTSRAWEAEIDEIFARAGRAKSRDDRPDEEIVGYNRVGAFD